MRRSTQASHTDGTKQNRGQITKAGMDKPPSGVKAPASESDSGREEVAGRGKKYQRRQELEQESSLKGDYSGLGAVGLKMAAERETPHKEVSYVDEKG